MAVTITAAQLAAALRLGDSTEETAEATRLLAYSTKAVTDHLGDAFAGTPDVVVNEAVVRLSGYLFDQPTASRGDSYANAMRNSGAGRILLPYRTHGVGATSDATAASTSTSTPTTPSTPGSAGVDQTARDAAAEAQTTADNAATAAAAAQSTADANAADIAALPAPTPAYTLPAAAPGVRGGVQAVTNDIIDTDTSTGIFGWGLSHVKRVVNAIVPAWARDATTAIPAGKLTNAPGGGGLNQAQVDARVQAGVQDPAETGNSDPWPLAKLGIGDPPSRAVRVVWEASGAFTAARFDSMSAAVGATGERLEIPEFGVSGSGHLAVWVAGDANDVAHILIAGDEEKGSQGFFPGNPVALTVAGTAGHYWTTGQVDETTTVAVSGAGLRVLLAPASLAHYFENEIARRTLHRLLPESPANDQIARYDAASQSWNAEDLPATPGGGGETATLITTITQSSSGTSTVGTLAQFNAIRTAINGATYDAIRIVAEYPRTFGTITDGEGFTEGEWQLPTGLTVPAASTSDTWFREFGAAVGDQSGTAEFLAFNLRPGGTNKLTVSHGLPAGSTIKVFGIEHGGSAGGDATGGGQTEAEVDAAISEHNTSDTAHADIRALIPSPRTSASTVIWRQSASVLGASDRPAGAQYDGNNWSGLGAWSTVSPAPTAGQRLYAMTLAATYITATWNVTLGNVVEVYNGTVQAPFAVRYTTDGTSYTNTRVTSGLTTSRYQQLYDAATNTYSELIPLEGFRSVSGELLCSEWLSRLITASPQQDIAIPDIYLANYPVMLFEFRVGHPTDQSINYGTKVFTIWTDDVQPASVASQDQINQYAAMQVRGRGFRGAPDIAGEIDFLQLGNGSAPTWTPNTSTAGWRWFWIFQFVRPASETGTVRRADKLRVYRKHDGTGDFAVRMRVIGVH